VREVTLPANQWPTRRLGDLLVRHNEIIHPGDRKDGEAVFVGLEHIEPNTGRRIGSLTIDLGKLTGRKPTFRRGQIVYGYLRPYLNKVWIADCDGCSSVDQFAFEVREELADTDFIAFFMRSETFLRRSQVVTTTGQLPRISIDEIAAVPIALPPLADQRRIAAELRASLGAVHAAHGAAADRLTAAGSLPDAYLREVFEGPGASGWKTVSVGDVAQVVGGVQKSPSRTPRSHHCPYLTVRNVQRGSLDLSEIERFEVTQSELERLRLRKGDILIVEGNGSPDQIGRNAIFDLEGDDWIHQNHVIRVRLAEAATHQFVSLFLNSPAGKAQMLERARSTSGLFTLSVDKIRSLQVPLPSLAAQSRIAADLSHRCEAARRLVARCREDLVAIETLPASLRRAAFHGDL
jgi:type I restriction enzyme S subunit